MGNYYAIGDIHGRVDMLATALRNWNSDNEKLILMGDYLDYGPYSKPTLAEVKHLHDEYGAVVLKGNHEYVFGEFLREPQEVIGPWGHWLKSGREETVRSFLGDSGVKLTPNQAAEKLLEKTPYVLDFIDNMSLHHETPSFIFAHAGIDLTTSDWIDTPILDFMMVREPFWNGANKTGKVVVFGHSRTGIIRGLKSGRKQYDLYAMPFLDDRVWQSPCGTKLGIDGGNVFGGMLHTAHLSDEKEEAVIETILQSNERKRSVMSLKGDYFHAS